MYATCWILPQNIKIASCFFLNKKTVWLGDLRYNYFNVLHCDKTVCFYSVYFSTGIIFFCTFFGTGQKIGNFQKKIIFFLRPPDQGSDFSKISPGRVGSIFFLKFSRSGRVAHRPEYFFVGSEIFFDPGRVEGRENFVRGKFKGEWVRVEKEIGSILRRGWARY